MINAMHSSSFYTIPPGCSFATDLAKGLLETLSPQELAVAEIYLPTRRALRALSAAFLQESKGRALILPRLYAIGDIDDDAFTPQAFWPREDGGLPPAIPAMRRLCLIARQVQSFPIGGQRPSEAQAFALSRALIQLLDQVQNAEFDIADMAQLWPKELASHWQDIAQFLSIMWQFWPQILTQEGAMDPVARRIAMMERQGQHWLNTKPDHHIIIAGSTGTLPATQKLMSVVSSLDKGCVVFPGMVPEISAEDWQAICEDKVHPLYPLSVTLNALQLSTNDIAIWPTSDRSDVLAAPRLRLLQEVMRPASQTEKWRSLGGAGDKPLMNKQSYEGFTRIEAQDSHEEAAIIALAMRQALEVPEKTAILVTADRQLARMVQSELRRFDIEIDDSAGQPLAHTSLGHFLLLLARLIHSQNQLKDLVSLAAHPLAAGQCDRVRFREMMSLLNKTVLRGPLAFHDIEGLLADESVPAELKQFVQEHIKAPLSPLLAAKGDASLADCAKLVGTVAEAFAATSPEDTSDAILRLWSGPMGEAGANALQELTLYGGDFTLSLHAFADILEVVMAGIDVRMPYQRQSRLAILGAVESRMISADLVILSGLNEGIWPPKASQDLWMNGAMAEAMGLPHKQWRIALSAHDFMMAASMPEVMLTRARRTNDSLTLPSRWLTRMDAVMTALRIDDLIAPAMPQAFAQIMAHRTSDPVSPIAPPAPTPPVALRPTRLSATEFDRLIGDPYSIYAKHILGLRALAPLHQAPNAALKGELFHKALQIFTQSHKTGALGEAHYERLCAIAKPLFAPWDTHYEVRHFWWPQFKAVAKWFIEADNELRRPDDISFAELQGMITLTIGTRQFQVTAKADRIVRHGDGAVTLVDYKTGGLPTKKAVGDGRATQMLVEAALIASSGYEDVGTNGEIRGLDYWKLQGRGKEGGEIKKVLPKDLEPQELHTALIALLTRFEDEEMAYHAEPDPRGRQRYSDYRHLARIKEWRVLEVADD